MLEPLACASVATSRENQRSETGSFKRRKAPPGSLSRRRPVTATWPSRPPAGRVAGSARSGGAMPRLTGKCSRRRCARGEDPEAAAQLGDRLDQGLAVSEEDAGRAEVAIGGVLGRDARPAGGSGRRRRRGLEAPGVSKEWPAELRRTVPEGRGSNASVAAGCKHMCLLW